MIFGAGEFLVQQCRKRGIVMYVGLDGRVWYRPAKLMPPELLRLLNARFHAVKQYLITGYGEDDGKQNA